MKRRDTIYWHALTDTMTVKRSVFDRHAYIIYNIKG